MCRFKIATTIDKSMLMAFKYIICVGSSIPIPKGKVIFPCLNTSYVSVQASPFTQGHNISKFKYIICVGSRLFFCGKVFYKFAFKYIICVGSRKSTYNIPSPAAWFKYIICVGSRLQKQNLAY